MANKVECELWDDVPRVSFYCPGCGFLHALPTEGEHSWQWNGSLEAPTLTPSILMRAPKYVAEPDGNRRDMVCHSFVTDGRIQFLGDCTHELAGQTVDLADVEE